jgi:hypothetical protein
MGRELAKLLKFIIVTSLGFMGWTWFYRKNQVARSLRPVSIPGHDLHWNTLDGIGHYSAQH